MANQGSPIPGLGSLVLPGLLSLIPGLAGLFGGNPQAKLRLQIGKLMAGQGALTNKLYQQNIASPAFSQAQGAIAAGANQASGNLASSLGARGIGTTGIGSVLSSLGPSLVGQQVGNLRTGAFQSAQEQAQQQIQQQIQALLGTQGPSPAQTGFGSGLNLFAPFLQAYLGAKYPALQTSGQGQR